MNVGYFCLICQLITGFTKQQSETGIISCPESQIRVDGKCFVDIRIEVPMGNYWLQNRETQDTELMMQELKKTAVFFGNRIDTRVHRLVVRAQQYLARLKKAHTKAGVTHAKGEKVTKLWTLIEKPIQKKVLRRLQHAKVLMAIKGDEVIAKQINVSWVNPGPKVKVMPVVDDYEKRLDNRKDLLSQIVTKIQNAYDQAKVNNKKVKKMLLSETHTQKPEYAAFKEDKHDIKLSKRMREKKALNFPLLPQQVISHF